MATASEAISFSTNEKQILKCIIIQHDNINTVKSNDFISTIAKDLCTTLKILDERSVDFTETHIISEGNKINSGIDNAMLQVLFNIDYSLSKYHSYYLPRLKRDKAQHTIQNQLLQDTLVATSSKGELDVEKITELRDLITEELENLTGKDDILLSPKQILKKYNRVLELREQGLYIFPTGNSYLDKHLAVGFFPGQMTTIFAATGMGKSAFALDLVNRQINKSIPALYVSLEMDLISSFDRLLANRNKVPVKTFYPDSEGIMNAQLKSIMEKEDRSFGNKKNFFFVEEPGLSIDNIEILIKEFQKRTGSKYLVLTIDLLTMLLDFSGEDAATYEAAMNKMHILAKKYGIHIVNIVQANRNADNGTPAAIEDLDKFRPNLNTIKNSNAIAERSRIVMSLFRRKHYAKKFFPDDEEVELMDDELELAILKQNMGELSMMKFLFIPERYAFTRLTGND